MKLLDIVHEFCAANVGEKVSMNALRAHVATKIEVAPGSESRALRRLRSKGIVSYNVPDHNVSEYLITAVH